VKASNFCHLNEASKHLLNVYGFIMYVLYCHLTLWQFYVGNPDVCGATWC